MARASFGDRPSPPAGGTDCEPIVTAASSTDYQLVNPKKTNNGLLGMVTNGVLDFAVYNEPITTPQTGCPGRWMFLLMWAHFQSHSTTITAIGGNWSGQSTNLKKLNILTMNNAMTIEDAAKLTNTGLYATQDVGYTNVHLIGTPQGTPGNYTKVMVQFTR